MDTKRTGEAPLTLQLVDEPTQGGTAAPAAVIQPLQGDKRDPGKRERDLRIKTSDEFLAAAADEYERGQVDQALWARSAAQAGGDESLAIAGYLRARAIALQLQRREKQADKAVRSSDQPSRTSDSTVRTNEAPRAGGERRAEAEGRVEPGARASDAQRRVRTRLDPRLLYAGGAAAALIVGVVAWVLIGSHGDAAAPVTAAASATVPAAAKGPVPGAFASASSATTSASARAAAAAPVPLEPSLEERVRDLQKAGNWNVLVLYAVEWVRKEPQNAAAWHALSLGYTNLRQYDEALDAGGKAVALAPANASYQRAVGHVNLTVGRLPEAAAAFDRALAVSADDPEALCGAAQVAWKQNRPKDADVLAQRMTVAGVHCDMPDTAAFAPRASNRKTASR